MFGRKNKEPQFGLFKAYQKYINVIYIVLLAVSLIINTYFLKESKLRFFVAPGIFLILTAIYLVVVQATNPINIALRKIDKKLSFKDFEDEIISLSKGNIASSSREYLKMLHANYLFVYDIDRALKVYKKIKQVGDGRTKKQYDMLSILVCLNQHDASGARKLFEAFKKQFSRDKANILKLDCYILIEEGEVIKDIESKLKINTKTPFTNIENCYQLMNYYDLKKNNEKAKEYASKILDYKTDFNVLNKRANEILLK